MTDIKATDNSNNNGIDAIEQMQSTERLVEERRQKLQMIRDKGERFPHFFERSHLAQQLQEQYVDVDKATLEQVDNQVAVAGRIMAKRGPFLVIQDRSGRIQLYADKVTQTTIKERWGQWDIGDIVSASGALQRSGKGDLYVNMSEYNMLNKALRPLPEKYQGLTDTEIRYRQRYVDLIVNDQSRNVFKTRSKVIQFIRNYFDQLDYMEVETPMLQVIPGGATARPFTTHHNALDLPMYLRIAPELYLKRLVIGGFERVYEINRNFRNEGLSTRHNPEFTMLEFYQAYSDYQAYIDLTEDLMQQLCMMVKGSKELEYQGEVISFNTPFQKLSVSDAILQYNPELSQADIDDVNTMRKCLEGHKMPWQSNWGIGKLQIELFEKTVEHRLIQPTFIIDYPVEVSPLSRSKDDNLLITERFEFFVAGREIANGFSELNDAETQAQRFREQVEQKDAGDDEAMHFDNDYVRALEYGLPPTAGEGIGIDRLVMLLTDSASIRDVLLFPAMKPEL